MFTFRTMSRGFAIGLVALFAANLASGQTVSQLILPWQEPQERVPADVARIIGPIEQREPSRDLNILWIWGIDQFHDRWRYSHEYAYAMDHELLEARDEKRLLRLQKQLTKYRLLIIDELGYVPLSPTGAELLFEVFSQRYERGSTIVTSNLPFDEWTSVFGSERLTGALLDRLTHHVHILEMNGESFRLKQGRHRSKTPN